MAVHSSARFNARLAAVTRPLSRRAFFGLAGASVASAGLAGCGVFGADDDQGDEPDRSHDGAAVVPTGVHQAGIVLPATAQANLLTLVFDLTGRPAGTIAALGETVLALTSGRDPRLAGISPGDLTLTVGAGPRLVAAVDSSLPGARALGSFRRERLSRRHAGGDIMVQICASDPLLLPGCAAAVAATGGGALTERWRQRAFRGPNVPIGATAGAPRNLLGFVDGIVGPRTAADLDADIWLAPTTGLGGATIAVLRRMEIDVERFLAQSVAEQEAVIGRRRGSAAPLSGGSISSDPDLEARTPAGDYLIPLASHVRRAHPPSTGVRPMLRRSYSFEDRQAGLFFVSFQNGLSTFVSTLNRMTASDALLEFTTTTRSATFLVLPGFDADRPLGASLFAS
jgi:dye decolorizing peroxidase